MGRKKSKKNMYFDEDVQNAIIKYNATDNTAKKNRIYRDEIHYAFDKLSENIINTFKFTYFDYPFKDVKNEVTSFLVMNMHKWDHTKGSKAFSYFSIVAKNYLILHNNNNYKKLKRTTDVSALNKQRSQENPDFDVEYINELVNYFEDNIVTIFKKKKDIDVAYAIVELMKRNQEIENFNKKALYILIREMTNVNTTHITKVVNVLKKHYKKTFEDYNRYGSINAKATTSGSPFF